MASRYFSSISSFMLRLLTVKAAHVKGLPATRGLEFMKCRIENDSMGDIEVPENVYWGAQTGRSLGNFKIGSDRLPPNFFRAYALVKKCAAKANESLGRLDPKISQWVQGAAEEVWKGDHEDAFPLVVWQTGSGTQSNMNVNEVIANRAIELAGGVRGSKTPVHPNDHVNCSQSTNDSFPTAMYVAAALAITRELIPALENIIQTLEGKSQKYRNTIKMGRTHLQDATPITLGQEIGSWAAQFSDARDIIQQNLKQVFELAIGGTAVGTGLNTHPEYAALVARYISAETGLPFVDAPNKFASLAAHDAMVSLSGTLNVLACAAMKVANDVRWLASGPRAGLGEIRIAENEPGSSIMPGKVNPTQAEALTMLCCQVMGNHTAVTVAGSQGNFQLNVFKPVIIFNVLKSIELLSTGIRSFDVNCAQSLEANEEKLDELKNKSLMLVTALAPEIGYDRAAKVAKHAHSNGLTLKEAVLALGILEGSRFDELVRPEKMLAPKC